MDASALPMKGGLELPRANKSYFIFGKPCLQFWANPQSKLCNRVLQDESCLTNCTLVKEQHPGDSLEECA